MRKLLKVHPEDFDVKTLLAAAREGRLYIEETDIEAARRRQLEHCQCEAMNYVSCIDEYVAPEWKPYIKELWTSILNDALFTPQLMLQKGRNQGQLNKYLITIIVDCLRAMRIYQCENLLELHKKDGGCGQKEQYLQKCRNVQPLLGTETTVSRSGEVFQKSLKSTDFSPELFFGILHRIKEKAKRKR